MEPIVCVDTKEIAYTYDQYLATRHWEIKTEEFYASPRFLGGCAACGSKKTMQVHHMRYKNIGNEPISDLTCLCRKCHLKLHGKYLKFIINSGELPKPVSDKSNSTCFCCGGSRDVKDFNRTKKEDCVETMGVCGRCFKLSMAIYPDIGLHNALVQYRTNYLSIYS